MPSNIDDYYSSISSTTDDVSAPVKKKLVIKKKAKIKPKKIEETVSEKQISSGDTVKESVSEAPKTLNDALEKNTKSKFQVVSRASNTEKRTQSWKSSPRDTQTRSSQSRNENTTTVSSMAESDTKTPKFKPGFAKSTQKPAEVSRKTDEKTGKKAKFYSRWKTQKHRNNLEDDWFTRSNKLKGKKKAEKNIEDIAQSLTARTGETVVIPEFLSLKEFSEKIWVPLSWLIAEFMKNGMMMTINSQIDFDTATLIAEAFEVKLQKDDSDGIGIDDIASGNIKDLLMEDDSSKLVARAPVISIMGHVDHGKTSLLDYIRKTKVTAGEAGWITQSIGAYQAEYKNQKITFLDTPGHEAFTIMRSRGAKSTDIAILVVAADEGVKPQTIESISHAKEAGIPVIVAINKMDKEGANPDHIKGQLSEHWLTPEDWGGETPMVPVSAQTGFGIEELLEIIVLSAEMLELKANPDRAGVATILESHLDMQLGPVASVLVNTGTIEKWSAVVCGAAFGRVKVLKDYLSKGIKKAGPGMPALLVGLDSVVEWGDILQVVTGIDVARQKSVQYQEFLSNQKWLKSSQLDILMSKIKSGNLKHLKIVLKADTNGSLEAIKNALVKLSTDETSVSIIHNWVGNITEWDVLMCGWSSAILVGFGVSVGVNAKKTLEDSGVEFIESRIIYHITERIEKIVTGMLDPKEVELTLCHAKVKAIFYSSKKFLIVGVGITGEEETIENKALFRVIRDDKVIGKWRIDSLKHWVEEMHKLEGPIECGIKLMGVQEVQEKDIIEVYKVVIEK